MKATFVIVGGGIAGVSCAETLAFLEPEASILLISESSLIKTVTNLYAITRTLSHFDVEEKESSALNEKYPNVKIIHDQLSEIRNEDKIIKTAHGISVEYKYLCICTGAQPKLIPNADNHPQVLGIRDTDSVEEFIKRLSASKRVVIVGNGGIASEIVYKLKNTEVHWVIKDKHISATFVDPGAAEFFQTELQSSNENSTKPELPLCKRMRYQEQSDKKSGAALGPDWYKNLLIKGNNNSTTLQVHYETEIKNFKSSQENSTLLVTLTNAETITCDLIVSATGVSPNLQFISDIQFDLSEDGGISVDCFMETSVAGIFAAGDVCSANWDKAKHWFQMKLWTQARQMGCYAAKCMSGKLKDEDVLQDFCFELFAHSTKLFGYKVILLGLYNGQGLGTDYEILLRMTKGKEYVKFVLQDNKLQGALLIGETDLEEMCENLILNQLDLSPYGDDILNPDIDIDDYFD